MMTVIAAQGANAQPGWGKLIALLVAVGIFWVFVQVHKRVKRVKDGAEINPFSPDGVQVGENEKTQVSTPSEGASTTDRKGWRKWSRKG